MSIRGYKRLTILLGIVVFLLGWEALYLFLGIATLQATETHTAKAVRSFFDAQEAALKADPTQAVVELEYLLEWKPVYYRTNSAHAFVIDHCRAQAISNVLSHLRGATGQDLGSDPYAWIQRYGKR